MTDAIGLIVAMDAEARALVGFRRWQLAGKWPLLRSRLTETIHLLIVRSGLGLDNAAAASEWLIQQGVGAVGVTGVCGGLAPQLAPGDLILPDGVMQEERGLFRHVWRGDTGLGDADLRALREEGLTMHRGPILSVQAPVLSRQEKASLFERSGALAVDMESAAAALAARGASLPFFAFRAVCDGAVQSVPRELADCLRPKGGVHLFTLFQRVAMKPSLVSNLFQMKRDVDAALTTLRHAWHRQMRGRVAALLSHE